MNKLYFYIHVFSDEFLIYKVESTSFHSPWMGIWKVFLQYDCRYETLNFPWWWKPFCNAQSGRYKVSLQSTISYNFLTWTLICVLKFPFSLKILLQSSNGQLNNFLSKKLIFFLLCLGSQNDEFWIFSSSSNLIFYFNYFTIESSSTTKITSFFGFSLFSLLISFMFISVMFYKNIIQDLNAIINKK